MKKLIIVLMVVAVASFLFVGCLPDTVTPVTPTEPVTPTAAKTDTPTITAIAKTSLYSSSTQYTDGISVDGVSVKDATIKLYVDDTLVGLDVTGDSAEFTSLSPSLAKVTEGVVVLYVTATATGLAESDASTKYTVTYDATAPTLASAVADSSANTITVTFSEDVSMALSDTTSTKFAWDTSALNPDNWLVNEETLTVFNNSTAPTIAKLTDKQVRIYCGTTVSGGTPLFGIESNLGYFIECIAVLDMATNNMATATVGVGVTAIATP